jgi:hypothetical protein
MTTPFTLWLEFEAADPGSWDIHNDFCNIHVSLPDGREYGINVWTYEYFQTAVKNDIVSGENLRGLYLTPPDLFVKELTRDCIEKTIADLLAKGDLDQLLNPSVIAPGNAG